MALFKIHRKSIEKILVFNKNIFLPLPSHFFEGTLLAILLELSFEIAYKKYTNMELLKYVEEQLTRETNYPDFRAGDNITVSYKIIEGSKERIQAFRGDVIQISGEKMTKTFTVRKISNGVGVERIFPFSTPNIVEIVVNKRGKVRRSRLYYLRDLVGKKARIKEKQTIRKK